ncbi:MAG: recombination protein RecR [Bacteroidetes bacterium HGW-Bacteroidetes-17]|nr:MAG: recombination protein RecR [Bacteroidetes bacterium HGW-Bacteroidetes-17]
MVNSYSSKLLEDAVNEFAKLPGIGRKSALRLALHLLKQQTDDVEQFGKSIIKMRNEMKQCAVCHNISDVDTCEICANPKRDRSIVCVVEDIRDVMAIENTSQFVGLYHVLGGIISPMEGIGPDDLQIGSLVSRVQSGEIKEVIMALSTTIEGDTTNFYIFKRLKDTNIKITTIARGISIGDELEYADEITLGRSILNRTPYHSGL